MQSFSRPGSLEDHAKRVAWETANGEVAQGKPHLRNQPAARRASTHLPAHMATESSRPAIRYAQRHAVGYRRGKETEALSAPKEARHPALRVPCLPSRQR